MTVTMLERSMTHQEYINWIEYYNKEKEVKPPVSQSEIMAKLRMI